MPVMDGFGVLNYLREKNILSKIPVVIISGTEEKETRQKVYKYNIADMLEKPFNLEIIKNYIRDNDLTKTKFCKLSKISVKTFNKILNQQANFRSIAIFRIAKTMKIPVHLLFLDKK